MIKCVDPSIVFTLNKISWSTPYNMMSFIRLSVQFLLIYRKAFDGSLPEDCGLNELARLTEINVDEVGVIGAKEFFEAKVYFRFCKLLNFWVPIYTRVSKILVKYYLVIYSTPRGQFKGFNDKQIWMTVGEKKKNNSKTSNGQFLNKLQIHVGLAGTIDVD